MILVEEPTPNCIQWSFEDDTTWDEFHMQLDDLQARVNMTSEPLCVIAYSGRQMPVGNAIVHLKRLATVVSSSDMILAFVIVNNKMNVFGQNVVQLALRLFGNVSKLHIVQSEDEALAIVQAERQT